MIMLLLFFLLFNFIGEGAMLCTHLPEGLFLFLSSLYLLIVFSRTYEYNRHIDILLLEFRSHL